MYGLQRALYGTLRPIEIEQLYERGWIAATEWLFAMSIFRDEFGVWYLVMFLMLFMGKVWGWIAEGRIETLEQQTPASPRLFHTRLILSLGVYIVFAVEMFLYCMDEVIMEARPGVMIMFVFEFAIICIGGTSTSLRYGLWAYEHFILKQQIRERLQQRSTDIAEAAQRAASDTTDAPPAVPQDLPIDEDDVDIHDLDLPGWEAKGTWQFALDIGTDFLKLVAYLGFFSILTVFYGIPIYIIRDLYLTMRSFTKRIHDYMKYQSATRNMHAQYPDASAEELATDNTCIVCREEMRPWIGTNPAANPERRENAQTYSLSERQRPKKLPCNHILHFSCLRSWLERQQACPICRRSVLRPQAGQGQVQPGAPRAGDIANQRPVQPGNGHAQNRGILRQNGFNLRLGPIRIFFGRVNGGQEAINRLVENINDAQRNLRNAPAQQGLAPPPGQAGQAGQTGQAQPDAASHHHHFPRPLPPQMQQVRPAVRSAAVHTQLNTIEAMLQQEIQQLNVAQYRVSLVRQLQSELDRARQAQQQLQAIDLNTTQLLRTQGGPAANQRERVLLSTDNGESTAPITLPAGWRLLPLHPLGAPPSSTIPGPSTDTATSDTVGVPPTSNANGTIPAPPSRNPSSTLPTRTLANVASSASGPTTQSNHTSLPIAQPIPTSSSAPQLNFGLPPQPTSHPEPTGSDDSADWLTEPESSPEQRKTTIEQIGGPRQTSESERHPGGALAASSPSREQVVPSWRFGGAPGESAGQSSGHAEGRRQPTVEDAEDENR